MLPQLTAQPVGLLFKRLLLLFWTMLFSILALTNLVDLLGEIGVLDWTFLDSNNFGYLQSVVDIYGVGDDVTRVLLFGAFAIEVIGAVLFVRALLTLRAGGTGMRAAMLAVCWGLLVWTAFVFAVEFFVAYEAESVFRELLAILVATGIALAVIPDDFEGESDVSST